MANHGHCGAGTSRPQSPSFPLPASGGPAQSEAPLFENSQTVGTPGHGSCAVYTPFMRASSTLQVRPWRRRGTRCERALATVARCRGGRVQGAHLRHGRAQFLPLRIGSQAIWRRLPTGRRSRWNSSGWLRRSTAEQIGDLEIVPPREIPGSHARWPSSAVRGVRGRPSTWEMTRCRGHGHKEQRARGVRRLLPTVDVL
jgi:hypothetical protein